MYNDLRVRTGPLAPEDFLNYLQYDFRVNKRETSNQARLWLVAIFLFPS